MDNYISQAGAAAFNEDNYVLVAAIDFGTTFSGYAFSFKSSPDSIKMNKNWSESMGFQSYKAPTCVLTGPDQEFMSFGFEAENAYTEITLDEELKQTHHLYRHFKMMLYDKKRITRESEITSTAGHTRKALDIFTMALRYLKEHLLKTVSMGSYQYTDESLVKWVITVPAIWNDEAKQFMREAAFQAGLISTQDSRQLMIALEPEAASLYCRGLDINHFIGGEEENKSANFEPGTNYMVIDAGGGTVDITVHEVLPKDQVREIHSATGGHWGGKKVDGYFTLLLKNILGEKFIDVYKRENPQQWLALMTSFEKVKKSAKPDGSSKIVLPLSWSMGQKYQEVMGSGIEIAIKKSSDQGVTFANGAFIVNHSAVVDMFQPVVNEIVEHVESLLRLPKVKSCQYFLLVGGFGESPFLQNAIEKKFGDKICLLVPNEAQMAVIKGAVLFGHRPTAIKSRISKKTYGIKVSNTFDEQIHDRRYLVMYDDIPHCSNLFDPYAQKGEEIDSGTTRSVKYYPVTKDQTEMGVKLYAINEKIEKHSTTYIDKVGMEKVGKFTVEMPDTTAGKKREVQLEIEFGGTEIYIHGRDVTTGNVAQTSIDFLTD